ncbi:MAG: hypothetical protein WC755_03380 [Candidatus Woesearchaeota archaeon]|jgi:hypothetical protein
MKIYSNIKTIKEIKTVSVFRKRIYKKAMSDVLLFAIRMFVLIPILFLLNMYANSFIISSVNTDNVEREIILERFLYSCDGFIYNDNSIGRCYPGYVDILKFSQSNISSVLMYQAKFLSAKFTLEYDDGTSQTAYYDEKHYKKYSDMSGLGSMVERVNKKYFVIVVNQTNGDNFFTPKNTKNAVLTIDAVIVDV